VGRRREGKEVTGINIPLFNAAMAKAGYTRQRLAKALHMADSTLLRKIRNNSFTIQEANEIISLLEIEDPCAIFFAS